ncbi:MAG: acetyl-CoA carboxylase biotin carboxylase subunit [Bryobacteraceae bacterium]
MASSNTSSMESTPRPLFRKVLVANRGEIAVRIIRALRDLAIPSVAVFSDVDRASLHVRLADEAVHIGPAPSSQSYLNVAAVLDAARRSGAEAIHPGYGFLSENADFVDACDAAGLVFIGPPAVAVRAMGEKTQARRVARQAGAPVVPGSDGPLESAAEAARVAASIGYPVMLKAAAGGGGKGMRRVDSPAGIDAAFRDASSEAERSFSSGAVYVEKLIVNPRHIEIQILGDRHGHMIHLGERECSLQRRHQKVIEESPSPLLASLPDAGAEMRAAMGEAAIAAARAAGYSNAGTVEFLVDNHGNFYFLEMNTRLQVEHPVTELVTGVDLVAWQLRIAAGQPLTLAQHDIAWRGWAIECRVCAEDPDQNFLPSPGLIRRLEQPAGPGIRVDSGIYAGWNVPMDYDPLLAKLIAWAPDRNLAVDRLLRALGEYRIQGIRANLGFFRGVLADKAFRRGDLHTGFIGEYLDRTGGREVPVPPDYEVVAALVAAIAATAAPHPADSGHPPASANPWRSQGRNQLLR